MPASTADYSPSEKLFNISSTLFIGTLTVFMLFLDFSSLSPIDLLVSSSILLMFAAAVLVIELVDFLPYTSFSSSPPELLTDIARCWAPATAASMPLFHASSLPIGFWNGKAWCTGGVVIPSCLFLASWWRCWQQNTRPGAELGLEMPFNEPRDGTTTAALRESVRFRDTTRREQFEVGRKAPAPTRRSINAVAWTIDEVQFLLWA